MIEYPIHIPQTNIFFATAARIHTIARSQERSRRETLSSIRKSDSNLGRAATYKALRGLGFSQPPVVPKGERGMPLWPEGVVGSITHCENFSVAAVAKQTDYRCLGIDFQKFRSLKKPLSLRICTAREREWCSEAGEGAEDLAISIFSAKESVFKAFFPLVRRYFGFHAVELSPTELPNTFRVVLLEGLSAEFPPGFGFEAHIQFFSDAVFTWVFIPG